MWQTNSISWIANWIILVIVQTKISTVFMPRVQILSLMLTDVLMICMLIVQLSDVTELASSLNLVIDDKRLASGEMNCSNVCNVGWAAEVVDGWNAVQPSLAAVESSTSTFQSSDTGSTLLQCHKFCKAVFVMVVICDMFMFIFCSKILHQFAFLSGLMKYFYA